MSDGRFAGSASVWYSAATTHWAMQTEMAAVDNTPIFAIASPLFRFSQLVAVALNS
jgi:hypothetical protein